MSIENFIHKYRRFIDVNASLKEWDATRFARGGPHAAKACSESAQRKAEHVMRIGIPREVYLEKAAGAGSGLADDDYTAAGATIVPDPDEVWSIADLVLKVKEPIAE